MDIRTINRREVFRYMGCREIPEGPLGEIAEQSLKALGQACEPRYVTASYPLKLGPDFEIDGGCFRTRSRNLAKNLQDCHRIILFAATLGTGADHLIQKYSRLEMSRALVMQAASTAMIEEYCDQVCKMLKQQAQEKGEYLRPRFSPGYGDFPLDCQQPILGALEAGKRIGIKLTDSLLMVPTKSVTAVIGVSFKVHRCRVEGCEACSSTDCAYRR